MRLLVGLLFGEVDVADCWSFRCRRLGVSCLVGRDVESMATPMNVSNDN